jgi:hypothetical protein
MENNSVKIRGLMLEIGKILDKKFLSRNTYYILTDIVIKMEEKYNLQEEEIIKQLELILKSYK